MARPVLGVHRLVPLHRASCAGSGKRTDTYIESQGIIRQKMEQEGEREAGPSLGRQVPCDLQCHRGMRRYYRVSRPRRASCVSSSPRLIASPLTLPLLRLSSPPLAAASQLVSLPRHAPCLVRFLVAAPNRIAAHAAPPPPLFYPARRRVAASEPTAPRVVSIARARSRPRSFPTISIKPTTFFQSHPPTTMGYPRSSFPVFMNLRMICNMSAILTPNLERGALGWRSPAREARVTWVIGEGGWRGVTRLRLGDRATTARWAARWRRGCQVRRVRRQRCSGGAAETMWSTWRARP